jgi:hypothetical protein
LKVDAKLMPEMASTRADFMHLTEVEVWKAISENDGCNPVGAEVTRLVALYMTTFKTYIEGHNYVPPTIMHVQVRWPIERVAVLVLVGFLEGEAGIAGKTKH